MSVDVRVEVRALVLPVQIVHGLRQDRPPLVELRALEVAPVQYGRDARVVPLLYLRR